MHLLTQPVNQSRRFSSNTQVATGGSVAVVGFCFVQLIVSANMGLALESEDGLIGYGLDSIVRVEDVIRCCCRCCRCWFVVVAFLVCEHN